MIEMMPRLDLSPSHWDIVCKILHKHVPNRKILVFGSRATWTAKEYSDLDLAILGDEPLPINVSSALTEGFSESDLPFKVDIVDWARADESFRDKIHHEGLVVKVPAQKSSSTSLLGLPAQDQQGDDVDSSFAYRSIGDSGGMEYKRWHRVSLNEVVKLTLSNVDKKSKENERKVRLCNYTDVYYNNFIHANMNFMSATATENEINKSTLQSGDVVITKDSEKHDDIGVPALVRENVRNLVCGYHLAILRPRLSKIDGTYLFYALRTKDAQKQFHSYSNGITRFGLRKHDIGLVEIPCPSLSEQRVIAHILATLDEKIELNRRMNETLEEMAQALFKSWFVDFYPVYANMEGYNHGLPQPLADLFPDRLVNSEIGEIPEGWNSAIPSDLIDLNPKRTLSKNQVAPYLEMANMPTKGHVPKKWYNRPFGSGTRFTNGDTLLARITPCLENGKTAFVNFLPSGSVGWGSTEYIVMRPKFSIPNEYAYCLARNSDFREFAIHNMTGTSGRQRVPAKALAYFPLVIPPKNVTDAFGFLIRPIFSKASRNAHQSRTLATLRDTLLPKLITGEIRLFEARKIIEAVV